MAEREETSRTDQELHGDALPHRPADDREEIYFEGSPRLRGELGRVALCWLLGLALIVGGPVLLFAGPSRLPWYVALLISIAGLLLALWPVLVARTTRYRISNYRIDFERGIFSKRIDTLELWHVNDIDFRQSLLERILDVGRITVLSGDDTTPELPMRGIPSPRRVFESLKQRIIAVKRQRGVIKMDIG